MSRFPALPNGTMREPGGSAVHAYSIAPEASDAATTPLDYPTTGLYVGGAGDVRVMMVANNSGQGAVSGAVMFSGVPAGTVLPIRICRLCSGTTATNIVALV